MVSKRTPGPPGMRSSPTVPGYGLKFVRGILGIDAHLDGMPAHGDVALLQAERLAAGDAEHLPHQVDAGDRIR